MKHQTLFGIRCDYKDEKVIHESVKLYLKTLDRTTSTVNKGSLLTSMLPYRFIQYHWNLNKEAGTYFDLFPNKDLDDKHFWENAKDCSWLILVIRNEDSTAEQIDNATIFIREMLNSIAFETRKLTETDDTERIPGDALPYQPG